MGDLVLKKTTTGQITLTPQDVAGNQTITFPAATGTVSLQPSSLTTGSVLFANSSGQIAQDNSNLFWDDTNNRLGIGTSAPSTALHVSEASSDFQVRVTGTSAANAGSIRAYNDGGQAVGLGMSGSTNSGYGANVGFLGTITNVPQLFLTNNIERARFLTTGNVLCLSGGSTSANGTGIAFPATQSASSDVNTLDDYEEGTFTPGIAFGGGTTGITYGNRLGRYIKVGRMVTFNLYCALTNKGSSTGALNVTGLPFAAQSISYGYNNHTLWINNTNSTLAGVFEGYIAAGQTQVVYEKLTSGFYGTLTSVTNSDVSNNTDVMCGGMYYTDN